MNPTFRLTGLALLAFACASCNVREQAPAPTTPAPISTACQPPTAAPAANASQQAFDDYSWKLFIALNWPARAGQRGQPDCALPLGSGGPTVWQSYKTVSEIFLPGGANPGPWNAPLGQHRLGIINIAALKNTSVVQAVDQAVGGWLIDQKGNPTYYDISANQASYDYIVANGFYNADTVAKAQNIAFPAQATEVKAAWRILTSQDDASRYLTTQAQVAQFNAQGQPTGGTTTATLGLVGLHIIVKAPGYPQWIWSTFEQVDNVPGSTAGNGTYSYYNANAPAASVNQSPCNWQQQGSQLVCTPKSGATFQTPDPLSRVTPIAGSTASVNTVYQQNLGTNVLRYYQLVTTQRPLMPDNPSNPLGQPTPALAANVTMESYIQPNSSCMNCHSMATPVKSAVKSDFSYLFKFAKAPATIPHKDEE
ncbi:hypothetical protein [Pseudomonas sp. PDM13]|uniref:hypothetical protein n=1 Tax=Pseudomonas sp. PDM13 TaxID=2769255 RepID=UPI0021E0C1A3|nr:hypothetical protein [Pseudomonas sp. PDM13]MCU9948241.1 hypothetical protein [Pseudomonas sp. PDM13]